MPETDSAPDTLELSELAAASCGVPTILEEISAILEAAGCYRRRDDAVREVVPDYGPGWRMKIVLPSVVDSDAYRIFSLVAESPAGEQIRTRLSPQSYLTIVASTNFKQRTRMMLEYFHADRLNFAVIGTPNRLEHDQGFFVKNGDGSADFKPIAHLYKSQVYQVADYLGVPPEISKRPPTTDTYSLPQTQEEFYFSVPYDIMDVCLYGLDHAMPAGEVAELIGLDEIGVGRVFKDIITKRRTTAYLHTAPLLVSMGNDEAGLPA
jgi:NAD+ synthase